MVTVPANERFLTQRQRYQPVTLAQGFSGEEMARNRMLTTSDQQGRILRSLSTICLQVNFTNVVIL
ncbi:TPA_asm: hypothetical protein GNB58_005005 [Salmonella enterica subsp. houtenae serovar 45:g,z51:-]|uniref:Uncharacterized protein n=1 Tax=Salmonella enterica subsp. houtenae serovar 45:g,z51:- TaxID=1967611 RepID=A0A736VFD7_SALHO|nr:hypothetical protein [Salmonella enterica subsp. houtenae str. CFSAN000557]HAE7767869.1 hypothetical protein [Salmonella enterica subsp. houtenae serovar 45:g,z51:-]